MHNGEFKIKNNHPPITLEKQMFYFDLLPKEIRDYLNYETEITNWNTKIIWMNCKILPINKILSQLKFIDLIREPIIF